MRSVILLFLFLRGVLLLPNLTNAYNYVISACQDVNIGYSMEYRTTGSLGESYKTYFDCSSLMAKAMTIGGYFINNPWFTTAVQPEYMDRAGWVEINQAGAWLPGDILWLPAGYGTHKYGHTEMVYTGGTGSGITMGAHTSGYAFARQVSINDYRTTSGYYAKLYRDPTQTVAVYKWHQSNAYLTDYGDDMTANAFMIYQFFSALGFTNEAIAGLLGNIQQESTINPGIWQNLTPGTGGYGLVQWTPSSNYFNYAASEGVDTNNPDENGSCQCRLINDCENAGQWLPDTIHGYTYTWAQFSQLTDYEEATKAFCWEYERPGNPDMARRIGYAEHWYNLFNTGEWQGNPGNPDPVFIADRRGFISDLQRRLILTGRH